MSKNLIEALKKNDLQTELDFDIKTAKDFSIQEWIDVQSFFDSIPGYPDDYQVSLEFTQSIAINLAHLIETNPQLDLNWQIASRGTLSKIPYPKWDGEGFWSEKTTELKMEINFYRTHLRNLSESGEGWTTYIPALSCLSDFGLSLFLASCNVRNKAQKDFFVSFAELSNPPQKFPMSHFISVITAEAKAFHEYEEGYEEIADLHTFVNPNVQVDPRMALLNWSENAANELPPWWRELVMWRGVGQNWLEARQDQFDYLDEEVVSFSLVYELVGRVINPKDAEYYENLMQWLVEDSDLGLDYRESYRYEDGKWIS